MGDPKQAAELSKIMNHYENLIEYWHVQSLQLLFWGNEAWGVICVQSNFSASFWPHERISKALLSGPGTCHRLGEEREVIDGESSEIHTMALSSFMASTVTCTLGTSGRALGSWGDLSTLLIWNSACQDAFVTLATLIYPYRTGMKKTWSWFTIRSFSGFYQFSVTQNIRIFTKRQVDMNTSEKKIVGI